MLHSGSYCLKTFDSFKSLILESQKFAKFQVCSDGCDIITFTLLLEIILNYSLISFGNYIQI